MYLAGLLNEKQYCYLTRTMKASPGNCLPQVYQYDTLAKLFSNSVKPNAKNFTSGEFKEVVILDSDESRPANKIVAASPKFCQIITIEDDQVETVEQKPKQRLGLFSGSIALEKLPDPSTIPKVSRHKKIQRLVVQRKQPTRVPREVVSKEEEDQNSNQIEIGPEFQAKISEFIDEQNQPTLKSKALKVHRSRVHSARTGMALEAQLSSDELRRLDLLVCREHLTWNTLENWAQGRRAGQFLEQCWRNKMPGEGI